jgi:hypothetical protein
MFSQPLMSTKFNNYASPQYNVFAVLRSYVGFLMHILCCQILFLLRFSSSGRIIGHNDTV